MATMISSGRDVVSFLEAQHRQIKALFAELRTAEGAARQETFVALRRLLAVHETAEEQFVHPAARKALPGGDDIVAARLQEEHKAKVQLAALEDLAVDSDEFKARIGTFELEVLAHAEAEERQEFEPLASMLSQEDLESMRKTVELAEQFAPTRPHPGVESQAANFLVGPFASMVDRARDAFTGKGQRDSVV